MIFSTDKTKRNQVYFWCFLARIKIKKLAWQSPRLNIFFGRFLFDSFSEGRGENLKKVETTVSPTNL